MALRNYPGEIFTGRVLSTIDINGKGQLMASGDIPDDLGAGKPASFAVRIKLDKGENIKQGDVNLLSYPLKEVTEQKQILKDLEYYETRVPNEGTPAMTQALFALLYARIGNADKAQHWFNDSYLPNILPPFRVIAETKGGTNPYFSTGAGGILQSVIMGFGGLEITPKGITQIKSVLPKNWTSLKITGVGVDKKTYQR